MGAPIWWGLIDGLISSETTKTKPTEQTFQNEQIKKEFSVYITKFKPLIEVILRKNGIIPEKIDGDKDWLNWDVSEQTIEQKQHGQCDSRVFIWGTKKAYAFEGIELPTPIVLLFERVNNKWNLLLSNGYVAGNEWEGGMQYLSPEIHMHFKRLFPNHIEMDTYPICIP